MSASFLLCKDCKDKVCLKDGKPCKKVEQYLRTEGIRGREWIRPEFSKKDRQEKGRWKEIPFTMLGKNMDGDAGFEED